MSNPIIVVLCSPSGGGKTSQEHLLRTQMGFIGSVSATTRDKRPGEIDGVDYYFLSKEEFRRRIENHEFIEWAEVYGNLYGTLVSAVVDVLKPDARIILNINIDGFRSIKKHYDKRLSDAAVGIFLMPPSMEVLEARLRGRGDVISEEEIRRRLAIAPGEIVCAGEFDQVIVTHNKDYTFAEIKKIVERRS